MWRLILKFRVGLACIIATLLMGCSPDYNWRTVSIADGIVQAVFPQKPQTETRSFRFAGMDMDFSLTGVSVKGATFAVIYAPLPEAAREDAGLRAQLGNTVIASFYRNSGLSVPQALPALGQRFEVAGEDAQGPTRLMAAVWLLPDALIEGVVTSSAKTFPDAEAREFFEGLKLPRAIGEASPPVSRP